MNFPAQLIATLKDARRIVVLTGAGISAESGVPTFRDAQTGLWAQYDPTELATLQAFERDPKLVWEWYAWRRELVSAAQPNPGHFALATIEQHLLSLGDSFTLITQNMDGLHMQAGSQNLIELHGNIQRTKCYRENIVIDEWPDTPDVPPHCPRCNGYLRPDVVWFNEAMPHVEWRAASDAVWSCDVLLSIGTSAIVQPAASLPYRALERGATLIEINPNDTPLTAEAQGERFYNLRGKAGGVLPALAQVVWGS